MTLDTVKEFDSTIQKEYIKIVKDYICSNMIMERKEDKIILKESDSDFEGRTFTLPTGTTQRDFNRWIAMKFKVKKNYN